MSTITHHFPTVDDFVGWLEERSEEADRCAQGAGTQRETARWRGRAMAFDDAARALSEAWIAEVDGDPKTTKQRKRKVRGS